MSEGTMNLHRMLSAAPSWVQSLLRAETDEPGALADILADRWTADELAQGLRAVIDGGARSRFSFLFCTRQGPHAILRLLARLGGERERDLLLQLAASDSLYIPYDLRARVFTELRRRIQEGDVLVRARVEASAQAFSPPAYKDLSHSPSNDIDHNFEIPETRAERDGILLQAATTAMARARGRLARRALGLAEADPAASAALAPAQIYVPVDAPGMFARIVKAPGMDWRDFIIDWNEILTDTPEESYTVAEILRLLLLDGEYQLPGHKQRAIADAVHMNLLKTFSGATIGLKAGVLFVEHGFRPEGSFFLLCENAIVGKGCVIDATGAVIVESNAFLGGGFSPILIHSHKHVRGGGTAERKGIAPTGFHAHPAARLPMDFVGMLEVFDLAPDRWRGIERMNVEVRPRASIWL